MKNWHGMMRKGKCTERNRAAFLQKNFPASLEADATFPTTLKTNRVKERKGTKKSEKTIGKYFMKEKAPLEVK